MDRIKNNILVIILIVISVILCAANYTPGTFLSGWDTLHPEFNFPEYFKRILFGVWESHQGLGTLSSQAHPSEFARMILYYPLSFILPMSFLRYSYFFITLILGPLGAYFFAKKVLFKEDSLQNKLASFGGGLFYLLNLGTLQHYIVPLEMFATHFATLPWLFLFLVQYLEKSQKKYLILFAVFTFFSASIAHTSTLWFAYLFSIIIFLFTYNFISLKKEIRIRSLKIILLTLLINAFWLLPNLYFILNQGSMVSGSKINSLFTEEAFANNKLFGTIPDILLFKNFLFNWGAYAGNGNFDMLLKVWINYLQQPLVLIIGYGLALISLIGLAYSIVKKNFISLSLLGIFVLSIFFLLTNNPPFGFLFSFLQNTIPLFKEALRFPFTKFSILLMFVMSCYFAFGIKFLLKRVNPYFFILVFVAFIYYMFPAFQGNLISPLMKVNIPSSYFSAFKLLNNKDYGRIATLPIHTFWAWNYYSWGYQGAGLTWFGFKDPILEREFDRWNPANEQYYREMSQAIYSQDQIKLNNVLQKYDVSYILWDKSIIAPEQGNYPQILFLKETENLLKNNTNIQEVFNSENLFIYQVNLQHQEVRTIKNPISVGPTASVTYDDFVYAKYNDYITYPDLNKNTVIYPFRNIINNENQILPGLNFPPFPIIDKQYDIALSDNPTNDCPLATPANPEPKIKLLEDASGKFLRYSSTSSPLCNHYSFPDIPREQGYLISIASRNISGLPLKFCVQNYISKRCDLFTQLSAFPTFTEEAFLLPPMEKGTGFDINLNNFAINKSPAVNDLKSVRITSFAYTEISQIEQYNPNNFKDATFLVYSQSFNSGWKAYQIQNSKFKIQNWINTILPFLFGKELKEHIFVNSWANGWTLDNAEDKNSRFVIIFWPQYLEYLGFALLIGTFVWLLVIKKEDLNN